jgi:NAD(P)-dependent dehydrogenase (short-subunit alcohol dehydrogenase family)
VNYLSQHLLTNLLLQKMVESEGKSSIVNVASPLHKIAKDDKILLEHWNDPSKYQVAHAYAYSKLALMLYTHQLNKWILERGVSDQVSVNCLNPGGVDSQIFRNLGSRATWFLMILKQIGQLKEADAASAYVMNLLQDDLKDVSGEYFDLFKQRELLKVIPEQLKTTQALWDKTEEIIANKL